MDQEELILNIPLRLTKKVPKTQRAERAIKEIRQYVVRHLKADEENIWIDNRLNEVIWSRGIRKPPYRLKIKAVKFEDGLVELSLPED